jgi:AcrR family transcriptional regulator
MKSTAAAQTNPSDERRKRILECAFDVVLRYGYQRMTMDDVAKACGMSRPALYLQFKNKGEIYQAIASDMMGRALERAQAALHGPEPIEQRLFLALKHGILDPVGFLQSTAHGAELMDMKHELAGNVMADWHAKKSQMIAAALDASGTAKAKGFSGMQLANILLDSIDGLKMRAKSAEEREESTKALVKLVCG